MDKSIFFSKIRDYLFKSFSQGQVDGLDAFIDYWHSFLGINDNRKLAYILATVYHETATTMQPIEEYGKGKGKPYGKRLKMNRKAYTDTDNIFYGRGHVQLTWYENYKKASKLLGKDLIKEPALMLDMQDSVIVACQGMLTGLFTGKKLDNYFTTKLSDPRNARRIINGLGCADKIAGYYKLFYAALSQST